MDNPSTKEEEMREAFLELLKTYALKRGKFKLSSGRNSNHYINCKPVTLSGEGLRYLCPMLLQCIEEGSVAVAGMTMGADPLVTGVTICAGFNKQKMDALIVRKEPKGHGTDAWIEGPTLPKGSVVTVLEDVITTGGSSIKAADKLRDMGYTVNRIVSIVNRQVNGEADSAMEEAGLELISIYSIEELLHDSE